MIRFLNLLGKVNCVTKSLSLPLALSLSLSLYCARLSFQVGHMMSPHPFDQLSEGSYVSTTASLCSEDAKITTSLTD